jgi:hypothetical protein
MSDLVKRLLGRASTRNTGRFVSPDDCETMGYYSAGSATLDREAAATIEAQAAEIERLRATTVGDWASQREHDSLTIELYELKARAEQAESALAEAVEVLRPFARAAAQIPDDLPDSLGTHCSSYKYQMSDDQYNRLTAAGAHLASREISLTLWIDGHPLRDFRAARAFIAEHGSDSKGE